MKIKTYKRKNKGSATVEACLVLPLFVFAFYAIFSFCSLVQTKAYMYEALEETAQYLAEYQYLAKVITKATNTSKLESYAGTNAVTAKAKFNGFVDDSEMVDKYVSGLTFTKAKYNTSDGYVYLSISYKMKLSLPLFGNVSWKVTEQVKQKAYVGYLGDSGDDDDDTYVYITDDGEVYHNSRSCYHIRLTITTVSGSSVASTYSNYTPCAYCAKGKTPGTYAYVTATSTKYHFSISCSGLKRTVKRVKKSSTSLPACSNCG